MATFTRTLLSGSTSGKPIKVAATLIGSGTTIHTAVAGAAAFDEVYLWVTNTDTSARTLTLSWGDTTDPDGLICKALSVAPSSGPFPVVTGLVLNGGLTVKAAADAANKLLLTGFVNQIA